MPKSQKNAVVNVRTVDPAAGTDGLYIDRCIASLQNSHSQITVLVQDTFVLNSGTTVSVGNFAGPQIAIFDDFVSFATQFETFRIRGIRFDVFDINPANTATGFFSTFHDQFTAANQPVFNLSNAVDGPDSAVVPAGTGKASFYWRAHGTLENQFVTTDDAGVTLPTQYFGGLRYVVSTSTATTPKYQVIVKALVDFRGRL
jgi:hypothetical protein